MNTQTAEETYTWECPGCGTETILGPGGGVINDCPPDCQAWDEYPGPNYVIHGPTGDKTLWDLQWKDGTPPPLGTETWRWANGATKIENPVWDAKQRKVVAGPKEEDV